MNDRRIDNILADFGISRTRINAPLQPEASDLACVGEDVFGREQYMTNETAVAWTEMQAAAGADAIDLQLVSAFRSVDYQCGLIRKKLDRGQSIDEILKVNAAPGFSEHHTGRALDLTTPGVEPLTEAFEQTDAFAWLVVNASRFDFILSYPRDNPYGFVYEPWHWAYRSNA